MNYCVFFPFIARFICKIWFYFFIKYFFSSGIFTFVYWLKPRWCLRYNTYRTSSIMRDSINILNNGFKHTVFLMLDATYLLDDSQSVTRIPQLMSYDLRFTIHDNFLVSNLGALFSRLMSHISHLTSHVSRPCHVC